MGCLFISSLFRAEQAESYLISRLLFPETNAESNISYIKQHPKGNVLIWECCGHHLLIWLDLPDAPLTDSPESWTVCRGKLGCCIIYPLSMIQDMHKTL